MEGDSLDGPGSRDLRSNAISEDSFIDRARAFGRLDMAPSGQPGAARVVVATVLSVAGSLVADAVLVKLATTVFPSTKGFSPRACSIPR